MKFFTSCKTKQELKLEFRRLVKIHHPDVGGDNETMATIINEYEKLIKVLPSQKVDNSQRSDETDEQYNNRISAEMQEIIDNISHLPITIEIIGTWIWVSGDTYKYKSYLTAYNFVWAPKKKMYYWHMEPKRKWYGKTKDIDDIRNTYGSQKVNNKFRPALHH